MGYEVIEFVGAKSHGLAICIREDKFEFVGEVSRVNFKDLAEMEGYQDDDAFNSINQAMFCLIRSKDCKSCIVVGNLHLQHHPSKDHVKMAQALYALQAQSQFVEKVL